MKSKTPDCIHLKGVRQNNLKNFDLKLPLGKLIVVTGLSGTGKSSLVFDTLHAEGQSRYVETFSPYTRQFLEMLERPDVDSIENIRPSIAIQQSNSVRTSRSTVGTMTELCDFFKVWFCHVAELFDPETGKKIQDDTPEKIWKSIYSENKDSHVLLCFQVKRPEKLPWKTIFESLQKQGYARVLVGKKVQRLDCLEADKFKKTEIYVIQDRIAIESKSKSRFIEAAKIAFHYGEGKFSLFSESGKLLDVFSQGLHSPVTGQIFKPARPALFSFNSPVGACPLCKGFGRVIEIDYDLVIPDKSLSLNEGVIKAFQGDVYKECLSDLRRHGKKANVCFDTPWEKLPKKTKQFILEGDPCFVPSDEDWPRVWYGVKNFFKWLESKVYKMHVRVFLSKYRTYIQCPSCNGKRLQPESLNWKWQGQTLPELYQMSISELLKSIKVKSSKLGYLPADLAIDAIISRLSYLEEVGLGYLSLDRTSRTLSGGETERVCLTSCLGTSLVDTLFVLDEPSIGLHSQNIGKLIKILRRLTDLGNTVVVVEHDEAIMRAADHIIELGPKPGDEGGHIVFNDHAKKIECCKESTTGAYLTGKKNIALPNNYRLVDFKSHGFIQFKGITKHNLSNLDLKLPLERLVCLSGVSGSGKSTLLDSGIYQGLCALKGMSVDSPASYKSIHSSVELGDVVLIDQSPLSKTPRSNPALYVDVWDPIRNLFARTDAARSADMSASYFSFNSGQGRCDHCQGLGYEKVEMQFLSDIYTSCAICDGKRFKSNVLNVLWQGKSIIDVLDMDIKDAVRFFEGEAKIVSRLSVLDEVGLGYLKLGQPMNTLSGGEAQRIKLVKYLSRVDTPERKALLLLDEPTTGLHRDDIQYLVKILQRLVDDGHSVIVIEHHMDVLKCADWIIEMGPGAGIEGGSVVAEGTPSIIAASKTATASFLNEALEQACEKKSTAKELPFPVSQDLIAAEPEVEIVKDRQLGISVRGAREHNLKNLSLTIPYNQFCVITGVSGSGKSSLAFDIIFTEGQRRFLESMSPYARQFVEQLPRPEVDQLKGLPPTVAIEQRVTRGSRKSTVATITEVAQYLRLLYAKIGIQYSPLTQKPVVSLGVSALKTYLRKRLKEEVILKAKYQYLCAPLVKGRKGHHQPLADWVKKQGYEWMRVDGDIISVDNFKKLDRYKEHDIDVVIDNLKRKTICLDEVVDVALKLGKGTCFLLTPKDFVWLSTSRVDPETGEAFPELDPKHFSWNSPKGWCPICRGYGKLWDWMNKDENFSNLPDSFTNESTCEACQGLRLNELSRNVRLSFKRKKEALSLPEMLQLTPKKLIDCLSDIKVDAKGKCVLKEIIPQVEDRLAFMEDVGLQYLSLDRSTATLSGGEAQRIRLASQLGSTLSGVLYVLDEPSIGLHARDNQSLIQSLKQLRDKGNSLLIVEHDEDTLREADYVIDLGPGAGKHGGEVLEAGSLKQLLKNKNSITGQFLRETIAHPMNGSYRKLPLKKESSDWLKLIHPYFRNLKGQDVSIPLGKLVVVCGISGAGKSTLIRGLLKPAVELAIDHKTPNLSCAGERSFEADALLNGHLFKKVIEVDQEPIGKTPRSTPATYIGAFDIIRDIFAALPESKMHGFTASTFSFNTKGGRCEACKGAGRVKLEMNFLPDTYVECEECQGGRYGSELNEVAWNSKTLSQVLELSFEEGVEFFSFHSKLKALCELMVETGLGYLTLGQSSPTLSGGEAQRLKLVSELVKGIPSYKDTKKGVSYQNLYILEEPTIGLHLSDCKRLIQLLHRLVDQGHTIIVIEHQLDIIAEADYVIEMGPEGGERGGYVVYQGPVVGLLECKKSPTVPFLRGLQFKDL